MAQQTKNRHNRRINFIIGFSLAVLHAAAPVNFLMNNWRFKVFSGASLMGACLKAAWVASTLALIATTGALVLVKRVKWLPSVLMVLVGNYLCPLGFLWVFQRLFFKAVDNYRTSSALIRPGLILAEVPKLNAFDCTVGIFIGLMTNGLAATARYFPQPPLPSKE